MLLAGQPGSIWPYGEGNWEINYSLIKKEKIKQYPDFPYSRYRNTDEISWEKLMTGRVPVDQPQLPLLVG